MSPLSYAADSSQTTESSSTSTLSASDADRQYRETNDVLYYEGCGSGSSGSSGSGSSSGTTSTTDVGDGGGCGVAANGNAANEAQVQTYFVKQFQSAGYSQDEALKATAGIMGNWQQESQFNPARSDGNGCSQDGSPGHPAYGIGQWCGDRIDKVKAYTASHGKPADCLGAELEYSWSELQTRGLVAEMKGKSPADAAGIYMTKWEQAQIDGDREGKATAIYNQIKDGGTAVPDGGANSAGTPTSSSTGNSTDNKSCDTTASDNGECQNPFRDLKDAGVSRIDGGYDYGTASDGAPGSGPVYAACPAKIISVTTAGSGWPGLGTSGSGAYIKYQITSGKAKDLYMYIAEDCTPSVKAGDTVDTSTPICQYKDQGTALETGWASGGGGTGYVEWSDYPGADNNWASNSGVDVDQFLQTLGAPHDNINEGPSTKGAPANWPKWTTSSAATDA